MTHHADICAAIALEVRGWEAYWARRTQLAAQAQRLAAKGMNDQIFTGTMTRLDLASDKAPEGSGGKRVVIPRAVAARTLAQLRGKPVNMTSTLAGHDQKQVIGVILDAQIVDDELRVQGVLFDKNRADLTALVTKHVGVLGMSFEASSVATRDQGGISVITDLNWTGAALLRRDKAAYSSTSVQLAA
jgi:hypothetical protein